MISGVIHGVIRPTVRATLSKGVGGLNDFRQRMPVGATYTRTGAATGLTLAGLVQSFAADVPQRTDRGLVLGPERTNSLLRSQEFDNAYWSKNNASISANATTAPDGTITADKIEETTATGIHGVNRIITAANVAVQASTFAKAAERNFACVGITDLTTGDAAVFVDLTTGAMTTTSGGSWTGVSAFALSCANGFWFIGLLATKGAGTDFSPYVRAATGPSTVSYAGTTGSGINIWQSDVQVGTGHASPIFTTNATATRGLPVFTEPVPSGRTKALLTYADATTTLVTGLTPGGTFDVASAVIGAGKGAFGASELITREWRA